MLHCSEAGRAMSLVFLGPTQAIAETTLTKAIYPSNSLRSPKSMKCCSHTLLFLPQEKAKKPIKACLRRGRIGSAWEKGDSCLLFPFRNRKAITSCVSYSTASTNFCHPRALSLSHLPAPCQYLSFPSSPITVQLFGPQDTLTSLVSSTSISPCYFLFSLSLFLHHPPLDKTGTDPAAEEGECSLWAGQS